MRSDRPLETLAVYGVMAAGAAAFVWAVVLAGTVPTEYRSASPGFGWGWEYDYELGVSEAGRLGAAPRPWPATVSGDRLLLPLNQPLVFQGLRLIYRGSGGPGRFRLDVVIRGLDPGVTYPNTYAEADAMHGLMIDDRRFVLETVTANYLRLRAVAR